MMKSHHGGFKVAGAFQGAARPLYAGAACRPPRPGQGTSSAVTSAADGKTGLAELAEGPYFVLALLLDASSLCRTDATCRLLRQLNRACVGPWRALGARIFHGMELEWEGTFEQPPSVFECCDIHAESSAAAGGRKLSRTDWKGRFRHFRADVPTFCAPFAGPEICAVAHPDEVAYFRCRLCTDVLDESCTHGVYLEVEVLVNPDNLSMAVVDFEAGGCSSVTFSPDTGAVIRERKVREAPRKVEGAYIQPLPTVPPGRRFHGLMGLYLRQGRLAFFRRCVSAGARGGLGQALDGTHGANGAIAGAGGASGAAQSAAAQSAGARTGPLGALSAGGSSGSGASSLTSLTGVEMDPWETTGFVSDLSWAEGRRLTPCLAFRDEGAYRVRIVCVGTEPPLPPERWAGEGHRREFGAAGDDVVGWSGFDWEVGPPAIPDPEDV